MSADNVILVQKRIIKERKRHWCVWHQSASSAANPKNGDHVQWHVKRRDAILAAHKLAAEIGYVEYGVQVV